MNEEFVNGGIINTDVSRLSAVFGYEQGEILRKKSGEAWTVEFRDGKPWAVRTPEHDTVSE
mgnify:FL=1